MGCADKNRDICNTRIDCNCWEKESGRCWRKCVDKYKTLTKLLYCSAITKNKYFFFFIFRPCSMPIDQFEWHYCSAECSATECSEYLQWSHNNRNKQGSGTSSLVQNVAHQFSKNLEHPGKFGRMLLFSAYFIYIVRNTPVGTMLVHECMQPSIEKNNNNK